jgi:hypothetical protein
MQALGLPLDPTLHRVSAQSVTGAKLGDPLTQGLFLPPQALGLSLIGSKLGQEAADQGGYRGVELGRLHARATIGFVIQ